MLVLLDHTLLYFRFFNNLYVSKYHQKKDIGVRKPEILELLIENYNKSIPAHRVAIKQYFD